MARFIILRFLLLVLIGYSVYLLIHHRQKKMRKQNEFKKSEHAATYDEKEWEKIKKELEK